MEIGEELFLEPLYDLTWSLAQDLQAEIFWPYFESFCNILGTTLLQVKENPGVVQAGYKSLYNIIGLLLGKCIKCLFKRSITF